MLFIIILPLIFTAACSTVSHNPSVYKYYIAKDKLKEKSIKKVAIASINVSGEPTRSILKDGADKIDGMVKDYLKSHDINVVPQHVFENAWQQAVFSYGNYYDPTTGKVDRMTWQQVMAATMQHLQTNSDIDAIVFTDVIEHDIQHSGSQKHYARWYGVNRPPATQGPTSSVSTDFNWNQLVKGASLIVTIYRPDGTPLFSSRGGLEPLHAIDSRKSQKSFVRRKKILKKTTHIQEGIELAFHPFITMKKYPGKKDTEPQASATP